MLLRMKFFTHMIQQIQQCPVRIILPAAAGVFVIATVSPDTITHLSASGCFPPSLRLSRVFRWFLFPPALIH